MKTSLQKLVGITFIVCLSIGIYFFTQDSNKSQMDAQSNQMEQSSNIDIIENTSIRTQNSLTKPYSPNKDTYSQLDTNISNLNKVLDTNISNLNKVLEQTKKALKEYNQNQPQNGIITDKEIDRLLTLDTTSSVGEKENLVEFENNKTDIKNSNNTEVLVNNNGSHNVTINNTTNTTNTTNTNSTTDSISSVQNTSTNQINTSVSSQILQLRTEISEVKETINQLSTSQQ